MSVLLAPRSGEESLDYLNQRLEEGKDYLQRKAREVRKRAENLVERGEQIAAEQREVVSKAVEAGRELVDRGRQIVAEQKEVISKAVEVGREGLSARKTQRVHLKIGWSVSLPRRNAGPPNPLD